MTKTKSTKRALLMSGLALLMCFAMLVGSTFAWFTDSVTSAGNKIKAGNLDVQLLMFNGNEYADISNSINPIFGDEDSLSAQNVNADTLWEPGKTQVAYLAIKNNGSLALKYTVALDVTNVSENLYKVMKYDIVENATNAAPVTAWNGGNSVVEGVQSVSGNVSLAAGGEHYFALAIHMDESAGNEYQNGQVNFDLTILATQDTVEADSFNNQYDVDADFAITAKTANDLKNALKAGGKIIAQGTMDADGVVKPFAGYPGETVEFYVSGNNVALTGGTYKLDETAKYGIYVDTNTSNGGKIDLSNMDITANSKWSFVIENAADGDVSVSDVEITAKSGAGLYGVGGKVTLNNVKVNHLAFDPAYSSTPWGATALAAAGDTDMTINSGEFYGSTYGLYVYSSGGTVTINGGTYKAPVVVAADAQNGANTYININGGNFDGKFESVNVFGGSEALITINGGNFTNFSTTANKRITIKGGTFDADPTQWIANGYNVVNNGNGTWTVTQ